MTASSTAGSWWEGNSLVQLVRPLLCAWLQGQQHPGHEQAQSSLPSWSTPRAFPEPEASPVLSLLVSSLFLWLLSALGSVSRLLFFCPDPPVTFSFRGNGLPQAWGLQRPSYVPILQAPTVIIRPLSGADAPAILQSKRSFVRCDTERHREKWVLELPFLRFFFFLSLNYLIETNTHPKNVFSLTPHFWNEKPTSKSFAACLLNQGVKGDCLLLFH